MNDGKPDWYERARKGIAPNKPFSEEMKNRVLLVVKTRNRKHKRGLGIIIAASIVVLIMVIIGYSAINDIQSTVTPTLVRTQALLASETVRAEGKIGNGILKVVADGKEEIVALGAASCLGIETDLSFTANYKAQLLSENKVAKVADLGELRFIQPNALPIEMMRLPFQGADVFILAPQYQDCHAIEIYAFAVGHGSSSAVQLQFQGETISSKSYYRPGSVPRLRNNHLILESTEGPGGEGSPEFRSERVFQLDLARNMFVQVQH